MAAVVERPSPVDIIADRATTALSSANKFYEARPTASGNSKSYTFSLKSESFVNLQRYLFAASNLPSSNAAFETSYPRALLEPQIKQRSANDVSAFYDEMQKVLVGINNHCDAFYKDTMSESVLVASQIANFANEASTSASTMRDALVVLSQPGVGTHRLNYQDALTNFSSATDTLRNSATTAEAACRKVYKGFTDFKKVVEDDWVALKTIDKQFDKLLPTADLDANMRSTVQAAYTSINNTLHSKNELEAKGKRWMFFIPAIGIVIGIPEWLIRSKQGGAALRKSITEYENILSKLKADVQHGTRLRAASRQVGKAIDDVVSTIDAAVQALGNMIGAFAALSTSLGSIDGTLENIASAAHSPYKFKRQSALKTLHIVSKTTWPMVVNLARSFAENGLVVTKEFDISALGALPDVVEITSANWGGLDVTDDAKALFYDGANIRIRTVEPGFQDPWSGVVKTCSVLHRYGDSVRLFVCRENSGEKHEHVLCAGTIDKSHIEDAQLLEIQTRVPPAPVGSKITICAMVWGTEFVENPQAYMYVYGCHAGGTSVKFANDSVGGGKDTWFGNPKSGTVYYVFKGGSQVRQLTGREGQEIAF
ncbi:hypothetical protein BKA62DRAFT_828789 [Auriculariales sp. MPI-PUGE-AT-0066]|nr:hypothetical protein BKA62DRAFT_828789 [Auriculariales sp. MPI-PUGE-AT-0066]